MVSLMYRKNGVSGFFGILKGSLRLGGIDTHSNHEAAPYLSIFFER